MGMCSDGNCPECVAARVKAERDMEMSAFSESVLGVRSFNRRLDEIVESKRNERRAAWLKMHERK
jgi:hypothetical protein